MPRMPRRCQWTEEACYHLMDRGHNRETIFADDEDRRAFLNLVQRYQQQFGFRIYHYCLMSNHFHLLVHLKDPRHVSPLMAGLLRAYVHHCHRRHGFVGHRWQGRFKSPAVQCRQYLLSCGRYIERNPVEAGLLTEPWQYPWSSAAAYALGEPNPLLADNGEYLALAAEPARRQALWQQFLLETDPREEVVRCGEWAIGDDDFRLRALLHQGRAGPRRRGRPRKQLPEWDRLKTACFGYKHVDNFTVKRARRKIMFAKELEAAGATPGRRKCQLAWGERETIPPESGPIYA